MILFLYDYLSDTDRFRNEGVVQGSGQAWIRRRRLCLSTHRGSRYHTRPMREWFVSELQESLGTSAHDVQMVINYLASRGDVDTAKVGMLGENSGGAIAILAAAADSRIAFVDAINPWGDWPDWLKESLVVPEDERPAYLKPAFLQEVAMLDPVKYLPQFSPGRIRIEQTAGDPMTPKDVQAKIAASASFPRRCCAISGCARADSCMDDAKLVAQRTTATLARSADNRAGQSRRQNLRTLKDHRHRETEVRIELNSRLSVCNS